MNKGFGSNLEYLMKEKRVTARELARTLNVPYKTVQDWIASGSRMPRNPEALKKLADYFSCSIEYLLFGEEKKAPIEDFLSSVALHSGLYRITLERVIEKKSLK